MYLGFDLGTTNVKALVVDDDGRNLSAGAAAVERFTTADNGVEQDIEQIWSAACSAIGQAAKAVDAAAIQAVGVSSQGGALQMLDAAEQPLGRVVSWLDGRGRPFDLELIAELGRDFLAEHIGHGGSLMTLGQVLRLRRQSPDVLRPPQRLGFVGDVIVGRLCGRRAHDATSLGIGMLYNSWLKRADPAMLARLGLAESQLPDLVACNQAAGGLRAEVAGQLGLRPGIPVAPAMHDQYAAALGAGAVAPGDVNFGAGTAWVLLANTDRPARPIVDKAFACSHPIANVYGQMLSLGNGGSAIEWVMNLVGRPRAGLDEVDALVEQAPAGSAGLRAWPLLITSADAERPFEAGARFDRVTLAHEPCHLARAVVEGLACELARHLQFFTAAGFAARRLSMCGSAAASRVTPQIVADVTGLPVQCVDVADVSAFGAAMIARALADANIDLAQLARRWSAGRRVVEPGVDVAHYRQVLVEYLVPFVQAEREAAR